MLPSDYAERLTRLIADIDAGKWWIPPAVVGGIEGMTSKKIMAFLNGCLRAAPDSTYLEVGVWKGKTFVAAIGGNGGIVRHAYAVDNWSEFGGPRTEFLQNLRFAVNPPPFTVIEKDCFTLTEQDIPESVDVFFYDGAHKQEDQRRALTYFRPRLADRVLYMVDDWNNDFVQNGTRQGLVDGGYEVEWEAVRGQGQHNSHIEWWCGFYMALLRKK